MTMLNEIKKNGEIILLMNGIKYEVNPSDIPTCCTWLPTAEIEVEKTNNGSTYNYKLTNKEIDVNIFARKVN